MASFFAAAFAKLNEGRTTELLATVLVGGGEEMECRGDEGVWGADVGGDLAGRSMPVRELVRLIVIRSLVVSRSLSKRSATSFSLVETSTGLAEPNGLDRVELAETVGVGPIFGEDRGLDVPDAVPDLGNSSNLRRPIWGVGGVEFVGELLFLPIGGLGRELLQSLSSGMSFGGPISPRPRILPVLFSRPFLSSSVGLNLLPIVHVSTLSAIPAASAEKPIPLRLNDPVGSGS